MDSILYRLYVGFESVSGGARSGLAMVSEVVLLECTFGVNTDVVEESALVCLEVELLLKDLMPLEIALLKRRKGLRSDSRLAVGSGSMLLESCEIDTSLAGSGSV